MVRSRPIGARCSAIGPSGPSPLLCQDDSFAAWQGVKGGMGQGMAEAPTVSTLDLSDQPSTIAIRDSQALASTDSATMRRCDGATVRRYNCWLFRRSAHFLPSDQSGSPLTFTRPTGLDTEAEVEAEAEAGAEHTGRDLTFIQAGGRERPNQPGYSSNLQPCISSLAAFKPCDR